MTAEDPLFSLFQQAQDTIQNTCCSFEEHFTWLEEAIVAAKQTFHHCDAALLPKTPAAKKRGRPKRSDSAISMDDGESPSKRSSIESTRSQTEIRSPECMPRRTGRAASRIAQERVAKNIKESNKRKLRRPSTPVESTRTTRKIKNTKQMEDKRDSVEIISKESQETMKTITADKSERQSLSSNEEESRLPTQQIVPKIVGTVSRQSRSVGKKICFSQLSSKERVDFDNKNKSLDKSNEVEDKLLCGSSNSTSLVIEMHEKCYSEEKEECKQKLSIQTSNVLGAYCNEKESCKVRDSSEMSEMSESRKNINLKGNTKDENNLSGPEAKKDFESINETQKEPLPPVPKTRITRTKQREILLSSSEENLQSSDSSASSSTHAHPVPKPRSTRTKQKLHSQVEGGPEEMEKQMLPPADIPKVVSKQKMKEISCKELTEYEDSTSTEENCSKDPAECIPSPEVPKVRSTRTKKRVEELLDDIDMEDIPKSRSTRTKKKAEEAKVETIDDYNLTEKTLESDDSSSSCHSRSTRTKKRQVDEQTASQPVRSTRTKRQKLEEGASKESDKENVSCFSVSSDELKSSKSPVTKNSAFNYNDQTATESVSTGSSENAVLRVDKDKTAMNTNKTNTRVTRSKVRPVPAAKKSPKNGSPYIKRNFRSPSQQTKSPCTPNRDPFKRDCCTPKSSDKGTPKSQVVSRVASPLRNSPRLVASDKTGRPGRATFKKCDVLNEVEEIASVDIEVAHSPARITRHSHGKAVKRESSTRRCARLSLKKAKKLANVVASQRRSAGDVETPDTRWARINPPPKTPSPQCPADKIVRPKMAHLSGSSSSHGSSSRITPKTYSRIRLGLTLSSSSNDLRKTQKKITTPDINRTKNIVTGVTSFIKVHPAKATREELEEKKQLELRKKREREEETRKKKEDLLKSKVEEQKRRNEERMRRAKELREEKERKLLEAKEQQEKDRRIREERLKEEQNRKKNQLLAKKQAEEEAKARKLREQMEEERRLEEKRLEEEARKAEEARRAEEARKAEEERKAEQLRLQEEEKRKRIAEVERIARERKEMEQLKLREEERLASAKQVKPNAVVRTAALNSTFTKESGENKENHIMHNGTFTKSSSSGKDRSDSYEMTPDQKKKSKKLKVKNVHDYDITELKSDDSTDDEQAPKKVIPAWAQRNQLKACLINQEYYPPDVDAIFPPEQLLTMPDLMKIFPIVRKRFMKRTSSAIWNTPPGKSYD